MPTDTTNTINMNLILPVPTVRGGPTYASDINTALTVVDGHDHSDGKGAQVTPSGLDMTSDLSLKGNNLNDVRTVRLGNQLATLNGVDDVCCPYFYAGNFWINNGSGTAVQITAGSNVVAVAGNSNAWTGTAITSNLTIVPSDTFALIQCNQSVPITISLPSAASVVNGRYFIITDKIGNSQSSAITLASSGSDTINGVTGGKGLHSTYGTWIAICDGVSNWQLVYTGHSGLTAIALTYGSNVFNSTGLSIGSNSWNSTTITMGSATFTSSALTFGNNALTSGGLILGSSGPSTGALRLANSAGIYSVTTGAADAQLMWFDSSNNLQIADSNVASIRLNKNVAITGTLAVSSSIGITGNASFSSSSYTGNSSLGASAGIVFSPARSKVELQPLFTAWTADGSNTDPPGFTGNTGGFRPPSGSLSAYYLISTAVADELVVPIKGLYNGATLSTVKLYYKPRAVATPQVRMTFDIVRFQPGTPGTIATLVSGGGHTSGSPGEVPAYASTNWSSHTITCNQNNVIDTSLYCYMVRIKEEQGTSTAPGSGVDALEFNWSLSDFVSAAL